MTNSVTGETTTDIAVAFSWHVPVIDDEGNVSWVVQLDPDTYIAFGKEIHTEPESRPTTEEALFYGQSDNH